MPRVVLRLQRHGRRNRPFYRVVAQNSTQRTGAKPLEWLGTYNPLPDKTGNKFLRLKMDRVKYWLGTGAECSETVAKLCARVGLLPEPPRKIHMKAAEFYAFPHPFWAPGIYPQPLAAAETPVPSHQTQPMQRSAARTIEGPGVKQMKKSMKEWKEELPYHLEQLDIPLSSEEFIESYDRGGLTRKDAYTLYIRMLRTLNYKQNMDPEGNYRPEGLPHEIHNRVDAYLEKWRAEGGVPELWYRNVMGDIEEYEAALRDTAKKAQTSSSTDIDITGLKEMTRRFERFVDKLRKGESIDEELPEKQIDPIEAALASGYGRAMRSMMGEKEEDEQPTTSTSSQAQAQAPTASSSSPSLADDAVVDDLFSDTEDDKKKK